jgi:uncharacterized glyoxalase superfamily protein PhnB
VQHMSAFEMESGPEQAWKVGTLAKATGLTVRALHHYDHIGLLGGVSSMTVITVDDADAHHARSIQAGAVIVEEPVDQPYGVREYGARDPEGQLWYFHSPLG